MHLHAYILDISQTFFFAAVPINAYAMRTHCTDSPNEDSCRKASASKILNLWISAYIMASGGGNESDNTEGSIAAFLDEGTRLFDDSCSPGKRIWQPK